MKVIRYVSGCLLLLATPAFGEIGFSYSIRKSDPTSCASAIQTATEHAQSGLEGLSQIQIDARQVETTGQARALCSIIRSNATAIPSPPALADSAWKPKLYFPFPGPDGDERCSYSEADKLYHTYQQVGGVCTLPGE